MHYYINYAYNLLRGLHMFRRYYQETDTNNDFR